MRIFVVDGREFRDPAPNLKVDEVHRHLMNFYPELYNAVTKESKRGEDTIIEFEAGTVLHSHAVSDIRAHLQSLSEILPATPPTKEESREIAREYEGEGIPVMERKEVIVAGKTFDLGVKGLDDESLQAQILERLNELTGVVKEHNPIPTREVVDAFLQSKRVAEKSKESYRHTLNVFAKCCPVLPSTPEEIDQYLARVSERTGKPISERTAAGYHTVLCMLYKFTHDRHGFPNVMEKVNKPVFKEKEPYAFTREEAKAILDEAAKNEIHLALLHLYLGHGWRPEEGVSANVGDISNGEINVRGKKRHEYMPLLSETKELLIKLANGRKPDEPLFLSQMKRRFSDRQVYNVVKAILRRSGVLEGKPTDLRIATHALRKTFSTLMLGHVDGRIIQRLLRHEKRDVTDRYLDISKDMLRQALEQYSPLRQLNGNQPQTTAKLPKTEYRGQAFRRWLCSS